MAELPKAGTQLVLVDKPDWDDFTEGKTYTLLSGCVQEKWDWFSPEVKAHVKDDKGKERSINLRRFTLVKD